MQVRRAALALATVTVLLAMPALASATNQTPPAAPAEVLPPVAVQGSTAPAPTSAELAALLRPLLRSPALGSTVSMAVVDVTSGEETYESFGGRPQLPASTMKVLSGLAALRALGPQARLTTKVVTSGGRLVLVGGGDPTLTRTRVGSPYDGIPAAAPSLDDLAERTVAALEKAGTTSVRLSFDDSLFTGDTTATGWSASYVGSGVVSPVSALSVDQGRVAAGAYGRSADPALAAAQAFAARLSGAGIAVKGKLTRVDADAGAAPVASVDSPPLADIVEHTLTVSDNDAAEALLRLAGAKDGDGSFAGGAAAVTATLTGLGVETAGLVVDDGSGLSRDDAVPASVLARALAAISVPGEVSAPYWPVLSGLPVAGLTGTLEDGFTGPAEGGRGVVRAKTGTLTGVVALAGVVPDAAGRLLAFAAMSESAIDLPAGHAQLERVAAALATS